MKLYSKPWEGHRDILGYKCDNLECQIEAPGEDLPEGWISELEGHYCPDCQIQCFSCQKVFSVDYMEYWMTEGLCEDCYLKLIEERNEYD